MKTSLIKTYQLFHQKEKRTVKVYKNALFSLILKAFGIVTGLIIVPLSLKFLDANQYGIWLTIYSIIFWLSYFDFGLGQGLKNYLSKSLAHGNEKLAKEYVSTTYFLLSVIFLSIAIILQIINPHLEWTKILNCNETLSKPLSLLMANLFIIISIRFILQIIIQIYEANQRVAYGNMINVVGQVSTILVLLIIPYFYWNNKLLVFGIVSTGIPVIVFLIFTLIAFHTHFKNLRPTIKGINFVHRNKLLGVGMKFLIIQLSILIITQLPNIIIAHHFGHEKVTLFFTTQKYFSIIYMAYAMVVKSYWPAFTEAYTKSDFNWINKSLRNLKRMILFLAISGIIMLIFSNFIISKWTLNKITPNLYLSLTSLFYYLYICYGGIYSTFLSSINQLNKLSFFYVLGAFLFYPIVMFFIKFTNLGVIGVVISMIISSLPYAFAPFEVKKILSKN